MTTNIVTATFGATRTARTRPLTRIDYGQILRFEGIELPNVYEVHFSNSLTEDAKTALGGPDGVMIPDEYLVSGKTVYAWVFLHTGADDGETRYTVTIPVEARPAVSDEPPTPEEHSVIGQLIGALETGVEAAAESARQAASSAESMHGAVLFDAQQSLTAAQQEQARNNIGATSTVIGNTLYIP